MCSAKPNMFSPGFVIPSKPTKTVTLLEDKPLGDNLLLFTQVYTEQIDFNREYSKKKIQVETINGLYYVLFEEKLYEKFEVLIMLESRYKLIKPTDLAQCYTYRAPSTMDYFEDAMKIAKKTITLYITKKINKYIVGISIACFHNLKSERREFVIKLHAEQRIDSEQLRKACGIYKIKEFQPRQKSIVRNNKKPETKIDITPQPESLERKRIKSPVTARSVINSALVKIGFPDKNVDQKQLIDSIEKIKKIILTPNNYDESSIMHENETIIQLFMRSIFLMPNDCELQPINRILGYALAIIMFTNKTLVECCKIVFRNCVTNCVSNISNLCKQHGIILPENQEDRELQLLRISKYRQNNIMYILIIHILNGISHKDVNKIIKKIISNTQEYITKNMRDDIQSNLKILDYYYQNVQSLLNIKSRIINNVPANVLQLDDLCIDCKNNKKSDIYKSLTDLNYQLSKFEKTLSLHSQNVLSTVDKPIDTKDLLVKTYPTSVVPYAPRITYKITEEILNTTTFILKIDMSNPEHTTYDYSEVKKTIKSITLDDSQSVVRISDTHETRVSILTTIPKKKPITQTRIRKPLTKLKPLKSEESNPFFDAIAKNMRKK